MADGDREVSNPKRIQRKRIKGWRMPEGAVYVGRPSRWGNPYLVHAEEIVVHGDGRDWYCPLSIGGAPASAVDLYREDLEHGRLSYGIGVVRAYLRGRDLACWCPLDQPCHADVLLKVANR